MRQLHFQPTQRIELFFVKFFIVFKLFDELELFFVDHFSLLLLLFEFFDFVELLLNVIDDVFELVDFARHWLVLQPFYFQFLLIHLQTFR